VLRCRDPSRGQHDEHTVAPGHDTLDNLAVVRLSGDDGDAPLERIELPHAALPAHANHLVAPIERVLHHVLPELSGRSDDAHLHVVHPMAPFSGKSVGAVRVLNGFLQRLLSRVSDRMAAV
jgi:hypothetical protein